MRINITLQDYNIILILRYRILCDTYMSLQMVLFWKGVCGFDNRFKKTLIEHVEVGHIHLPYKFAYQMYSCT